MIEIKIPAGKTIEEACGRVHHVAIMTMERVVADFNGFEIDSERKMQGNLDAYDLYVANSKKTLWHDAKEIPVRTADPLLIEYLGNFRDDTEVRKYKTYYVGYYTNELKSAANINFVALRWCYITDIA